jgi:transcription elongation factor Elf1
MSLEGSRPVERTEKLILGKEKEPLACGGCGVSAERKVSAGTSSVNVCSIRG